MLTDKGELDKAIQFYNRSKVTFQFASSCLECCSALHVFESVLLPTCGGSELLWCAQTMQEDIGDRIGLCSTLNNIAIVYFRCVASACRFGLACSLASRHRLLRILNDGVAGVACAGKRRSIRLWTASPNRAPSLARSDLSFLLRLPARMSEV